MSANLFRVAGFGIMVMLAWGASLVLAQEAVYQEIPSPSSVQEDTTPIERSFIERFQRPGLFPRLKEKLKDTDPFFRDTSLNVHLRSYYLSKERYDDSSNEAWAIGGALAYQSGWWLNHFEIGAVGYLSEPLYGPDDRDGTNLLKPGQMGYAVLGQLYGRVKLAEDHFLNLYRNEYDTPFINRDDGRMTPKTFEGYTYQGASGGKEGAPGFRYGGGYIDKIKERNSTDFESMAKDAGAPVDRGVAFGGGIFLWGGFSVGVMDYHCDDVINIGYAEAKYTWSVTRELGLLFAAQFTEQRSVGEDLLTGTAFSTNQVGVKSQASYGGAMLTLAFTTAAGGADLQNPWSSYPGYTSVQVLDFNRAGENGFLVKASYDFTRVGIEGLTAYSLLVHGWEKVNPSIKKDATDENEWDFDLQWRPKSGPFKNFWPRIRYAIAQEQDGKERYTHDFRVILNYDFSLL